MGSVNTFNALTQPQGLASPFGASPGGVTGGLPFFQNMNQGAGQPFGMSSMFPGGLPGQGAFPGGSEIGLLASFLNTALSAITMLINTLLTQIASGAISGKAPEGTGSNLASGMNSGSNTGGSAPTGATGPASNQQPNSQGFILPLDKQYIDKPSDGGDFGPRVPPTAGASSHHNGNDFGTGGSTPPIYAVKSGTIKIIPNNGGAGNTVEIDHGNGLVTKYFHLSSFGRFKTGDRIEQGQVLGNVGTTGTSTGNHLHFEVHLNGKAVDPWPYLQGLV